MKINIAKRIAICLLSGIVASSMPYTPYSGGLLSYAYTQKQMTVKATSLNVRSGPGTSYSKVTSLAHGARVTVTDEVSGTDGATWCAITVTSTNGSVINGYVSKTYLKDVANYTADATFEAQLTSEGFPESYKNSLRQIHAEYPSWVFRAVKTNLDWNEAVTNESVVGRNLVYTSSISSWKSTAEGAFDWNTSTWPGFDSSSWVAASQDIISYYMDPRNFLDSTYVFQFLDQDYDASVNTSSGVELLIKDTFMSGSASAMSSSSSSTTQEIGPGVSGPGSSSSSSTTTSTISSGSTGGPGSSSSSSSGGPGTSTGSSSVALVGPGINLGGSGSTSGSTGGSAPSSGTKSYVDIIMNAAQQSGVNPYVLTAMIIQEQGVNGTSGLISGTDSTYPGIYNFFNIEAYQSGSTSAVQRGLWWASQSGSYGRPWNSVEAAIVGGAQFYGENYVKAGQDTFYLKKFNVVGSNLYKHQYMTNVQGAAGEGAKLGQAYSEELKKMPLIFEIPVYNNMPDQTICPSADGSPNNKLGSITVDGFSLTPTFEMNTESYDLIVDNSVSEVNVSATAKDSTATISGVGTVNLSNGANNIDIIVTAQSGSQRTYRLNIVRQSGGPTYSGTGTTTTTTSTNNTSSSTSTYGPGGSGISSSSGSSGSSGSTVVLIGPGN